MTDDAPTTAAAAGERPRHRHEPRPRRSCLAVPGSNPRMLEKARTLAADEVFCDLEDAVAPDAKAAARANVVAALTEGGWGSRLRVVRVNDWTTAWTYTDVVEVVTGAGEHLDALMLPKVTSAAEVVALDLLLTQVERSCGLEVGRIALEAQVEDARGLLAVAAVAAASDRLEALHFGPGDFIASMGTRTLVVGQQPAGYVTGDAYHHVLMSILVAARAHDLQALDGPYPQVHDVEGFRVAAASSAALGLDGKWVLHPGQVDAANEMFSPRQEDFDRAEDILEAYAWHTSGAGGARGAVMLGDEMVDEASRKMALGVSRTGRAAGMARRSRWQPPSG